MRAVWLREFGGPEVLSLGTAPDPVAGPGQVVVDVEYVNITFVETQFRATGAGPFAARVPMIPGNGVGGVVASVGQDVSPDLVGTRVITSTGGSGGYAEQVAVDADMVFRVPDDLALDTAVALLADGRTATMMTRAAAIKPGERVLVEAAAGGVGSLIVQLAKAAGAHVIAAVGSQRKATLALDLGADMAINYTEGGTPDNANGSRPEGATGDAGTQAGDTADNLVGQAASAAGNTGDRANSPTSNTGQAEGAGRDGSPAGSSGGEMPSRQSWSNAAGSSSSAMGSRSVDGGWAGRVREAVGAVDVVFDGVGGAVARAAFELLGSGGRMVSFGLASGGWAEVSEDEAAARGVTLVRPSASPAELRAYTESALAEAVAGRLRPVIGQRFPLGRAAAAHAAIQSRATVGKTLLETR